MKSNRLILITLLAASILTIGILLHKNSFSFFKSKNMSSSNEISTSTSSVNHAPTNLVHAVFSGADFEELMKDNGPLVIKFGADWCGACKYVEQFLPLIAQKFAGKVSFYTINTDNQAVMTAAQEAHLMKSPINYLPTFVFIQTGITKEQTEGAKAPQELIEFITKLFNV